MWLSNLVSFFEEQYKLLVTAKCSRKYTNLNTKRNRQFWILHSKELLTYFQDFTAVSIQIAAFWDNHVVLKADTNISKQQSLYFQADFSKILVSTYMTIRFLNPEEQNVKKLHDFLLPTAVRTVSLMWLQCAGHAAWWGDRLWKGTVATWKGNGL
jgi:hypothetical protein